MSYVVTTHSGLGMLGSAAVAGAQAGGTAGGGGSGVSAGAVTGIISATSDSVLSIINLVYGIQDQRAGLSQLQEQASWAWEDWHANREMAAMQQQQDREIRGAQNVVLTEQERRVQEEGAALERGRAQLMRQIESDRAAAERQARYIASISGIPNWVWWAFGGVGAVAVVGIATIKGLKA